MSGLEEIKSHAKIVCDVLNTQYETHRYHPRFTLWGVSYFWDSNAEEFTDGIMVKSELNQLMPFIFESAKQKGQKPIKPRLYTPKAAGEETHYGLLAMRNRDIVTSGIIELAGSSVRSIEDILDDTRLMTEAAELYLSLKRSAVLPENADFSNFLIHYVANQEYDQSTPPEGQFKSLLERCAVRYESKRELFTPMLELIPERLHRDLEIMHIESQKAMEVKVEDILKAAYRKKSEETGTNRRKLPNASKKRKSPRDVFGRRRVRVGVGSDGGFVDWEAHARRLGEISQVHFNPNTILRQRLANMTMAQHFELYRTDPEGTMKKVARQAEEAENPEDAKALYTTLELLRSMALIDSSDRIKHTMIVNRKK